MCTLTGNTNYTMRTVLGPTLTEEAIAFFDTRITFNPFRKPQSRAHTSMCLLFLPIIQVIYGKQRFDVHRTNAAHPG